MNLPCRPLSSNLTTPSMSANSVSSLPRPTFLPGFHFVPRCRARMLPPSTASPPNFFRPNRCECESRPLRDEPTPFLCAIVLTSKGRQESEFGSQDGKAEAAFILTPDPCLLNSYPIESILTVV